MSEAFGVARLAADLVTLGYSVEVVKAADGSAFAVIRDYEIGLGKFAGRKDDLAVQATPDFPKTTAAAIHVRAMPQLYEQTDTVPKVRNIQPSILGPEWRYWSHNFGWSHEKTARRLMSQVNQIIKDA